MLNHSKPMMRAALPVIRFAVLYGILGLAWIAIDGPVCGYVQTLGNLAFGGTCGEREIDFERITTPEHPHLMRMVIVNRALMNADGSGPVRNLDLDIPGLVAQPLALLAALILSTPVPGRRRWMALFWGLVWEHVIVLSFIGFCIWIESSGISLAVIQPFWKTGLSWFRELLTAQLGFGVPILLWIVLVFRRGDERLLNLVFQRGHFSEIVRFRHQLVQRRRV
jgi:hypothetical protein